MQSVFPSLIYKSLCDVSTHHITCVLPALSRGCPAQHSPVAAHNTTGFLTILYQGTPSKVLVVFLAKTFADTDLFAGTDCCRMVHKISCIMRCNGEKEICCFKKTLCLVQIRPQDLLSHEPCVSRMTFQVEGSGHAL